MSKLEERDDDERDLKTNFSELNIIDKYKFISDGVDEEAVKKDTGFD